MNKFNIEVNPKYRHYNFNEGDIWCILSIYLKVYRTGSIYNYISEIKYEMNSINNISDYIFTIYYNYYINDQNVQRSVMVFEREIGDFILKKKRNILISEILK